MLLALLLADLPAEPMGKLTAFLVNAHDNRLALFALHSSVNAFCRGPAVTVVNPSPELALELRHGQPLPRGLTVNPTALLKKRFHGSLLEGIISSMQLAIGLGASHVVSLGSRFFLKSAFDPERMVGIRSPFPARLVSRSLNKGTGKLVSPSDWHWPKFFRTDLARALNYTLVGGKHEGLVLPRATCLALLDFMGRNMRIMHKLFETDACVEEFALHSIAYRLCGDFSYGYVKSFAVLSHNQRRDFNESAYSPEGNASTALLRTDTKFDSTNGSSEFPGQHVFPAVALRCNSTARKAINGENAVRNAPLPM